ncbi:ATP-binding protein [Marinilabiliaceae bacterium ANBcel2]|nr:ATP-binding protein [Marinilabiliaceae bacterium ANBcel2]
MKQQLKDIILENQQFNPGTIIKRDYMHIPLNTGMIISIMGARRSGKTFLLYYLITKLKKEGLPVENIVFINFEDERLNLKSTDLDLILQAYQELFPDTDIKNTCFFFDEIQNVNGWEKFIRRVYDTKSKNLFVTGSNSRLLSTEIATELRGRTVSYTIYPFSFNEFVKAKNGPDNHSTQTNRAKLITLAEQFMFEGGFPELTRFDRPFKIKILQEYFNVMIYRDIIERYTISNPEVLKYFIKKIFSAVTGPLSVNKAYNDLKSMGYKVSNKYLYEYLHYCNSVFLTQSINKFDFSEIKQAKSDKKVYIIDNGLLNAIDFHVSENRGKLLENMVAMEFLKQGKKLFYYKDQTECDFIVQEERGNLIPVQVSLSLRETSTRLRETKGLINACNYIGVKNGTIITFDEEETISESSCKINAIPFYRYFRQC